MPMAHQPSVAIIGQLVGMAAEEARNLGLHGMRQQRSRAVAQYLGQWVGKHPWLGQLDDIILGHGVSLLQWRSGGVEHPHDTPPYPFTPSPTSAHNSSSCLPPWFDTKIPSIFVCTARLASSGSRMPFKIIFPGKIDRIHSMSFQVVDVSKLS